MIAGGTSHGLGEDNALISVVVPAYNAAATIDRTLSSISGQTYRHLEIIVVDDGSRDDTAMRVRTHAKADGRIMVLQQGNGGVARARNAGIAAARGDFVAMIDADDLLAPDALEALSAELVIGGTDMALAYGGYCVIDNDDRILRTVIPGIVGDVRRDIAARNFIGCGSGILVRRDLLVAAGGYDSSLHDRDAQGCEDHLLYFQLAQNHRFGFVPRALLGYRHAPGAMSGNAERMIRSHEFCLAAFAEVDGQSAAISDHARSAFALWLLGRAVEQGDIMTARNLLRVASGAGIGALARTISGALRRRLLLRPGARFL